jgi:hypothetical protein
VVAAADRIESSLFGGASLLDQLGGRKTLMTERHAVSDFVWLSPTGPEHAADGLDDTHWALRYPGRRRRNTLLFSS